MSARFRAWIESLGDQFWLRPALLVLGCLGLAEAAIRLEAVWPTNSSAPWGYSGGAEGARTLLSAVASSTIGVAGTVFSITIAALSLASGQMGPRLLRNFVRDPRNQVALGIFLGTFAYALMVLRTVRTEQEAAFVPHLAVTGAILLAMVCLGTLVWFVHHIALTINVETVVDAVHRDLCRAIGERTRDEADIPAPAAPSGGVSIPIREGGYLQAIDREGLADWAQEHGIVVSLCDRPGAYLPSGYPVATLSARVEGADTVLAGALTFGRRPGALQDLEYAIRQLTEIAVRALSPGINDPFTAGSVLDHFGEALCRLASRHLPSGVVARGGRVVFLVPASDYDGLCDAMFHMIRQNARGSVHVLARMLEVLARVAEVESRSDRTGALERHAGLVLAAARRDVAERADLADLEERHRRFVAARAGKAAR